MAYNKEYYEQHKEQFKKRSEKYREAHKEEINKKQMEKYWSLSDEERQAIILKQREKRAKNPELSRINYSIDSRKRFLKKYLAQYEELEQKMFELKMVDTWDSSDYKYSDELFSQMHKIKEKIDLKNKQIDELLNYREKLNGKI